MITKEKFKAILQKSGSLDSEGEQQIDLYWDSAFNAACAANAKMPGIGFFSVAKRMNCFFAICRELDVQIDHGEITSDESQLALLILRTSNSSFNQAMTMFEIRGPRLRAVDRVELPNTAHQYLQGLEHTTRW